MIPSSSAVLGDGCFHYCFSLQIATFCPGSRLDFIPDDTFDACFLLESIMLPSSVKQLGNHCFGSCRKFANAPLPPDSEVARFDKCASSGCSSFKSLLLPSSVGFVGKRCFIGSESLSNITLASPPHLPVLLDLPANFSGSIRDSAETQAERSGFDFWNGVQVDENSDRIRIEIHSDSIDSSGFDQQFFRRNLEFEGEHMIMQDQPHGQ
jgi:hypothetical protein